MLCELFGELKIEKHNLTSVPHEKDYCYHRLLESPRAHELPGGWISLPTELKARVVHPSPPRQNEAKHINEALKENTERQTGFKLDGRYAVCNSLQTAVRVSRLGQNKLVS